MTAITLPKDLKSDLKAVETSNDDAVVFTQCRGMDWHCAGCSIERFGVERYRNISARITIRCIGFIMASESARARDSGN